jgi:hypothetical protein
LHRARLQQLRRTDDVTHRLRSRSSLSLFSLSTS